MATLIIVRETVRLLAEQTATLSGTVKNSSGTALTGKKIICYKNGSETVVAAQTVSGASGEWAMSPNGNHNDRFRVIASGAGNGSDIFDDVTGVTA